MERRRFIELGALAGASATSQACAPSLHESAPPSVLGDLELRRRMRWMDRIMGSLEHMTPRLLRDQEPRALSPTEQADVRLTQSTFRSLLLTGSVGDLPEEERLHPEVVGRLGHAAPEVDYALFGMMARLSMMPADEQDSIQQALREDPDVVDRIGEHMDQDAGELGVPLRRRLHLRKLVRHVGWRLKRQSLSAVLDECLGKVQRLTQREGRGATPPVSVVPPQAEIDKWSRELEHLVSLYTASPAGPDLDAGRGPQAHAENEPRPSDEANQGEPAAEDAERTLPFGVEEPMEPPRKPKGHPPATSTRSLVAMERERRIERAKQMIKNGGIVAGIGAGLAALTGGLISVALVFGAIGLTVAAIVLIVGLIILSVGAVRLRRAKKGT